MKPQNYRERLVEVDGWQVNVTSYETDGTFHSTADNVSPGAWLARTTGATREEAEERAIERARHLLARTRRQNVEADSR
jgi:hypothetical protein